MKIVKSSGQEVDFNPNKIRRTLKRAGASKETIARIVKHVESHLYEGMTTRELYDVIRRELRKEERYVAQRYSLRSALLKLGPAGFKFEKYVASILRAYLYEAYVPNRDIHGLCTRHEIDVIARKTGQSVVIEAKFRNRFSDAVNLKDTMATWARYIDLLEGAKAGKCEHFDEAWIVTNGRFSDRAKEFGNCKGMHLIGWNSKERPLAPMVDHVSLYPITVIDHIKQWELDRFASKGVMLCRELADKDPQNIAKRFDIPFKRAKAIILDCRKVIALE